MPTLPLRERINKEIAEQRQRIAAIDNEFSKLKNRLETEKAVLARLRSLIDEHESEVSEMELTAEASLVSLPPSTIPEKLFHILSQARKPMRVTEISKALAESGYKSSSGGVLMPAVISALRRRGDLFKVVGRGIYTVQEKSPE